MCPKHHSELNHDTRLAAELAALPQLSPARDAWPLIAHQLQQPVVVGTQASWIRWLRPAIAALLVVALGTITLLAQRVDKQDQVLQAWIGYSQELETELRQLQGRNGSIRGHQAMAIGQLEELVAVVDSELSRHPTDSQRRLQLWQQRATLLNDLVTVRAGQRLLPPEQQQRPVVTLNRPTSLVSYEL